MFLIVIPYYEQPSLPLGPVTIHAFGVLVVIGILVGWWLAIRRSAKVGLDPETMSQLCQFMVLAGFAGAWLARTQIYAPGTWSGFSSFGGLSGGLAVALLYLRRKDRALDYLDAIANVFPVAWMFGRAGCFVAHDHPGRFSNSFLAVQYPEGARYDLGLIEMLFMIPIALLFWLLGRRQRPPGFFLGLFLTIYGPFRIALNRLHIESNADRWFGTAAAVAGIAVLIAGWRAGRRNHPGH